MRKTLVILGLLGFLSQPVMAQSFSTGTPVVMPGSITGGAASCPVTTTTTGIVVPVQTSCPAYAAPTGGAAPVTTVVPTTSTPVTTGFATPVTAGCPTSTSVSCPTGFAVSIVSTPAQPYVQKVDIPKKHWWNRSRTGYRAVCPGITGGAASICPGSNVEQVLIPKKHFWERDEVRMMQVPPATATGGAAAVCTPLCPVQPVVQPAPQPVMPPPTGGAAPVKKPVRALW